MPVKSVSATAARCIEAVVIHGHSIDRALGSRLPALPVSDRPVVQEIVYGSIRWYYQLLPLAQKLLVREIRQKDRIIECLILSGLYQIDKMATPSHAVVDNSVSACRLVKRPWATGLVNATLRRYLRQRDEWHLNRPAPAEYAFPDWLLSQIQSDWPNDWRAIVDALNRKPPMVLRVNNRRTTASDYIRSLKEAGIAASASLYSRWGVVLDKPHPVDHLPGFRLGDVSVQDHGAQLLPEVAGELDGQHVLDACAAPGGKCCHLLECNPALATLVAVDQPGRMSLIKDNLSRLGLNAHLIAADTAKISSWWAGHQFDCVILDAPCSGTGVIHRHPDIKIHRTPVDIEQSVERQDQLLKGCWEALTPGGALIYVTCSILRAENDERVQHFLSRYSDARIDTGYPWFGHRSKIGVQMLPGRDECDGFYYAKIIKEN